MKRIFVLTSKDLEQIRKAGMSLKNKPYVLIEDRHAYLKKYFSPNIQVKYATLALGYYIETALKIKIPPRKKTENVEDASKDMHVLLKEFPSSSSINKLFYLLRHNTDVLGRFLNEFETSNDPKVLVCLINKLTWVHRHPNEEIKNKFLARLQTLAYGPHGELKNPASRALEKAAKRALEKSRHYQSIQYQIQNSMHDILAKTFNSAYEKMLSKLPRNGAQDDKTFNEWNNTVQTELRKEVEFKVRLIKGDLSAASFNTPRTTLVLQRTFEDAVQLVKEEAQKITAEKPKEILLALVEKIIEEKKFFPVNKLEKDEKKMLLDKIYKDDKRANRNSLNHDDRFRDILRELRQKLDKRKKEHERIEYTDERTLYDLFKHMGLYPNPKKKGGEHG